MKRYFVLFGLLVLFLAACSDDDTTTTPPPEPQPPAPGTIAEIATATPDLSSLVDALNTDQVALLSDETQSLTVLAPVNSAFAAASDLLATLSAEQIATVINYHVLAGEFLAADVTALDGQTLPNSDITVSVTDAGVFLQGAGNDAPVQIIQTDIDASNGVVHLLDGVLLPDGLIPDEPAPGTIAEVATATPDLSSLVGALNTDQVALLSDETQSLTVLAPVNSAFAAASDLLATLSAEQVATVINYHVLASEFLAADVVALDGQTLPNSDITVSVTDAGVFLQGAGNDAPVQIIQTDIDASNGVVHLLDGVLLPDGLIPDEPAPGTIAEIVSFTASATEIEVGQSSTLTWQVTGDEPITLTLTTDTDPDATSELTGDSIDVSPTETTTYTLTATNSAGSTSSDVTITVTEIATPALPPVTGTLVDSFRLPLTVRPAATVRLLRREGDEFVVVYETEDNRDGNFALENVVSGEYLLEVRKENFITLREEVVISSTLGSRMLGEIELFPDLPAFEELVITLRSFDGSVISVTFNREALVIDPETRTLRLNPLVFLPGDEPNFDLRVRFRNSDYISLSREDEIIYEGDVPSLNPEVQRVTGIRGNQQTGNTFEITLFKGLNRVVVILELRPFPGVGIGIVD